MKRTVLAICCLLFSLESFSQLNFVERMKLGLPQHVVVYGTSLSSGVSGKSWMDAVTHAIGRRYGRELISYSLTGKGGMWSVWGVKHIEDSVIAKKPDAVLIEFGINDAFSSYETSVSLAKLNLIYMIDRIRLYSDSCDILLQIMNMPIGKSASLRPNLEAYYEMYREVAEEKKVVLIDHYPNWMYILNQGEDLFRQYVPDGIHPNIKGAEEVIAPHIIKTLNLK